MASTSSVPQPGLAERTDIHKSCKSLETLLSVLNDYCEAVGAVALLHKKLAKALRETAGLKVTGEIAGNALNASATIYESLFDVDTKFAKVADREYDGISSDVKKWFKKLAKEEKGHDERITAANARIKQAGQLYERKTKKSPREGAEEHARYINLISSLGPEIAQEKYNHSLAITDKHASTTYSVAATISRIADAEWLRSCESVRRFSPTIGVLGEWRSLCEGGWIGPIPRDLPDIQENPTQHPPSNDQQLTVNDIQRSQESTENTSSDGRSPTRYTHSEQDNNEYTSPGPVQRKLNNWQSTHTSTPPSSFDPPKAPFTDSNTGSVRSLSAFPSPPTHFPIPPMSAAVPQRQLPLSKPQINTALTQSPINFPTMNELSEPDNRPSSAKTSPVIPSKQPRSESPTEMKTPLQQQQSTSTSSANSSSPPVTSSKATSHSRGDDYTEDREVPVEETKSANALERTDTGGSIVSAMRTRYSTQNAGPSTPVPKEIPRLPLSVNNLANRYEPVNDPASPRHRAVSPPAVRQNSTSPINDSKQQNNNYRTSQALSSRAVEDMNRRREEEIHEKEQELVQRQRELEHQSRALERDRATLINQNQNQNIQLQREGPRIRQTSFQERESPRKSARPESGLGYPYNDNNHYPRNNHRQSLDTPHAASCGCEACSVNEYRSRAAPSPHDLRPPEKPLTLRPEKPKGWMRRLSMPVGQAFNLGSSDTTKKGLFSQKNSSTSTLRSASGGVYEDGRLNVSSTGGISGGGHGRRSYDASGLSNRSMSNLSLGLGRR